MGWTCRRRYDEAGNEEYCGEVVGIVGPNGAGKTTTMEMMEGLRRPDAGSCTICGFDSHAEHRSVRERIGLSLQQAIMPRELIATYGPESVIEVEE